MDKQTEKILASLSYFSVFFAPFLFPLIIWIGLDRPVSTHGKRAILYHIAPYLFLILVVIAVTLMGLYAKISIIIAIILLIIGIIGMVYFFIYNLYCGIKVLLMDQLRE